MSADDKEISPTVPKKDWVNFDEESGGSPQQKDDSPAVLDTQSVQVTLENKRVDVEASRTSPTKTIPRSVSEPVNGTLHTIVPLPREPSSVGVSPLSPANLQNVPLNDPTLSARPQNRTDNAVIRQGFANGDVIVTILPQNSTMPWIIPAKFRPELVPEELMAQGLTLTVEDYVHVMSQLVNDHRFTLYNVCYKRILMAWITLAFIILLCILFAHLPQYHMFGAGIAWLLVNAGAIFFCMWIKLRLSKNLELCLARINMQLMKHKILMGVDDRGKISCHKINLCFIYFDPQECIGKLHQMIEQEQDPERAANKNGLSLRERYDMEDPDIIITGATNTRVTQQNQRRAEALFTRYSQRWVKLMVRGGLTLGIDAADRRGEGAASPNAQSQVPPRHMATRLCPCQYIEDHLQYKPEGGCKNILRFCVIPDAP